MSIPSRGVGRVRRYSRPAGSYRRFDRLEQVFGHDREVAHAVAGRVEDGVGDRRRDADDGEFTDALGAEGVDLGIRLVDERDVDVRRARRRVWG